MYEPLSPGPRDEVLEARLGRPRTLPLAALGVFGDRTTPSASRFRVSKCAFVPRRLMRRVVCVTVNGARILCDGITRRRENIGPTACAHAQGEP